MNQDLSTESIWKEAFFKARELLGKSVPHNTERNMITTLTTLFHFVCKDTKVNTADVFDFSRNILFCNQNNQQVPAGHNAWIKLQLEKANHFLIEWIANIQSKTTGNDIKSSTLKHVLGVQQGLKAVWHYDLKRLFEPVFANPNSDVLYFMDNKALQLQAKGLHTRHQNVISKEDLILLLISSLLSSGTPKGSQMRLVFTIGLPAAMRPTALALLRRY